ncbi:50S ribosomal protein L16 [Candidatus Woesearchaeota archaeon]|nr:50S ribosomal protein L16 [Candidatus Woesearchaeota archaeon]
MARLRKFNAYRRLERPYTRKSKKKGKNYVRAFPNNKVVMFDMGDPKRDYDYQVDLISKDPLQIRHNSIESARQTANKALEKALGKNQYHFKIRIFPHHVLRENPLAAGAGADRMSTGMKKSFGKPIGLAARIRTGQKLFTVKVMKGQVKAAQDAMKRAGHKVPCACQIATSQIAK